MRGRITSQPSGVFPKTSKFLSILREGLAAPKGNRSTAVNAEYIGSSLKRSWLKRPHAALEACNRSGKFMLLFLTIADGVMRNNPVLSAQHMALRRQLMSTI